MINEKYQNILDNIQILRNNITPIIKEFSLNQWAKENYKNYEVYAELVDLKIAIDKVEIKISNYSGQSNEGQLVLNMGGRFFVRYPESKDSQLLTHGACLDLFINDEWKTGIVEYSLHGWYFKGDCKYYLEAGMKARIFE